METDLDRKRRPSHACSTSNERTKHQPVSPSSRIVRATLLPLADKLAKNLPAPKASFLERFLDRYVGILVGEAYPGYKPLDAEHGPKGLGGFIDHARRKFIDAARLDNPHAVSAIAIMDQLYDVERRIEDPARHPDQRRNVRQDVAKPVMDELHEHLKYTP